MMKKCSACGLPKSLGEFQKRTASTDGLTASCKSCLKMRDAVRFHKERDRRYEWSKQYFSTERGKQIVDAARDRWQARNPEKRSAHIIVGNAVRDGKLMKMSCEYCSNPVAQAHHDDYSKPLEVRWLCSRHHAEFHRKYG